jgi:hypothetical protein
MQAQKQEAIGLQKTSRSGPLFAINKFGAIIPLVGAPVTLPIYVRHIRKGDSACSRSFGVAWL